MKKGIMAGFVLAAAFTLLSCDEEPANKETGASANKETEASTNKEAEASVKKDKFTDPRDGKTYSYVKIGNQTWMAQNLDYHGEDGYLGLCYGDNPKEKIKKPENCKKYGRLYDLEEAMKACPKGWHVPSQEEWNTLFEFAGDRGVAGKKLKAKNGWDKYECKYTKTDNRGRVTEYDDCATDEYGFSALPGGSCGSDGISHGVGRLGYWVVAGHKYNTGVQMDHANTMVNILTGGSVPYSVRCLQDSESVQAAPKSTSAPETASAPAVVTAADYSSALQTGFPNGSLGENKRPIEVFFQSVSKSGDSYTVNGYTKTKAAQDTFSGTLTITSETKGGSCGAGTELKGSYNFNEKESKTSGRFAGNFVACENSGSLSSANFDGKWIKHSNNNQTPCSWKK